MTQRQLADHLGCSQSLIAKLEAGKGQVASCNLLAWSEYFGVSPGDLLQSDKSVVNHSRAVGE